MKKYFMILLVSVLLISGVNLANAKEDLINNISLDSFNDVQQVVRPLNCGFILDEKLNLTEEQKEKASILKKDTCYKVYNIMQQIQDKKLEARAVKLSRIAVWMQEEKLEQINKDILALKKQCYQIRKQNLKAFEEELTLRQRLIFKKTNRCCYRSYRRSCGCNCPMF